MNNTKGKVSIIVPVYNVEKYLEDCLKSIVNQIYRNIEVIIINDGSTDNSYKIIQKYKEKYNFIKVITQKNKGISESRNIGLKNAIGEFVLFVDSDDYLDSECIESAVSKINKDNSEMVIFNFTRVYDADISGENENVSLNLDEEKVYSGKYIAIMMLKNLTQGYVWNKLFKRENLLSNNFKFEKGRTIEDIYPVFKEIINYEKVSYIPEYNYKYRQRKGSAIHTFNKSAKDDYVYAIDMVSKYSYKNNIEESIVEGYKLVKSCILIQDYYLSSEDNSYSYFNKCGYNKIIPKILKLKMNRSNYKGILLIALWNARMYSLIMYVKVKLRFII